ncbi:Thymidylate kinase [Chryseobacterium ureilyticum]|uniref:Thymidylate kinase n=1 Tax=Chryseobacterium ureilyticum TaxID=373668 RepID=A0A1N7LAR9_9FLAO|nr:hypothetical protein [Chryseobacterium ureilyticum]SIS70942.1 Thymidylate kinase [Chryseobacterium ureilyticum]
MNNLFKNTGYKLYVKQQEGSKKISFSYIPNPDGTVRWFWNSNSKKPLFLKFYNTTTGKGKLFAIIIHFIFLFRLQRLFFKKEILYYTIDKEPLFDITRDWSIFTGTIGPNNKAVLYANGSFYKIADTQNAQNLIHKELNIITYSGNNRLYIVPKASLLNEHVLKLSDISVGGKREKNFNEVHACALQGIKERYQTHIKISEWKYFDMMAENFKTIHDKRIPSNLIRKIDMILKDIDREETIHLSFSHGDFTPWNCYTKNNTLAIYDWELASFERPLGFDFFHYIIQNAILVQHLSWTAILEEIKKKNTITLNLNEKDLKKYLKFYLLTDILYYLKVYSEQEQWHVQIHWLLNTWSEALNMYLTKNRTSRELLVMDIFDYIHHYQYGALKFHDNEPENLTLNSDIDIIIQPKDAVKLISYIKQNSVVNKIKVVKKSFMFLIRIITKDHKILNIDLIQSLKWKNLEFMNSSEMISHAKPNKFGVKICSLQDTAKYLYYFYTLNNSEIPDKYIPLVHENLSERTMVKRSECIKRMKAQEPNKGLSLIKNTFHYLKDMFKEKGFVVTFSGVDGAGKSTIISEVSELIEKRYRRPVIVLRHRPSLLPILSVYIKGSEKAKQDVLNSLPRQGQNRSSIASLLRFSYYYIDYIFGQFIIYLKYVLRGKIVLYDRYYFDFIADSRRSNIQLPQTLTEAGYHLLMKPKFNFFLYASPEEILSRKKELSYHSICNLTKEYSQLFSRLDKQNQKSKYLSIENINLSTTVSSIMNTIITAR